MSSDDTIWHGLGTRVAVVVGLGRCWPVGKSQARQGYYDHITALDDDDDNNIKKNLHRREVR